MTFIEVDICHQMEPLRMLYFMTLTFIFKVELFLLCIYKKLATIEIFVLQSRHHTLLERELFASKISRHTS